MARWRTLEAVALMTTELHGNFKPLFYPDTSDPQRYKSREMQGKRFSTIADQLGENTFLAGDCLIIADTYLFVMLMWAARARASHTLNRTMPSISTAAPPDSEYTPMAERECCPRSPNTALSTSDAASMTCG